MPRRLPRRQPPRRALSGALPRAVLRRLPLAGALLGIGLAAWLVATNDLAAIAAVFGRIGLPGLAAVVLVRALVVVLCGTAWAALLDRLSPAPPAAFLALRFVREGVNVLLPVASVGGDVLGGRLLTFWGVSGPLAAASIMADMLFLVLTQALFTVLGVVLLTGMEGEAAADLARRTLWGLAVAGLALAAFFALQRSGAARAIEDGMSRLGRRLAGTIPAPAGEDAACREPGRAAPSPAGVQAALDAVWGHGRRLRLAQCAALHLLAWLVGAAEIALVLACIGDGTVDLREVVVIEALTQAIKSAAFVIPSGIGVQEGGFILVGALFGLDASAAIALSLAKRVPDVALGLPSLLVWQHVEARRDAVRPGAPP